MGSIEVLKTLYVTKHRSRLGVTKGNLLLTVDGKSKRIPVERVRQVLLFGSVQVSSEALALCSRNGILIADISRGGSLRYVVQPRTSGNVLLRLAQYEAFAGDRKSDVAREIVAAKVRNSQFFVARWAKTANSPVQEHLREIEGKLGTRTDSARCARSIDVARGIEGDAAYLYFRALGAHLSECRSVFAFQHRNRRPPRDPINALLSFTYAIVHAETRGALDAVGLDPQIGFLHEPRPGRASLALDIMEEMRPSVADQFVVRCITRRQIGQEHFEVRPGGGVFLNDEGRSKLLGLYDAFKEEQVFHRVLERSVPRWTLPTVQATLLARNLRGDVERYLAYVAVDAS